MTKYVIETLQDDGTWTNCGEGPFDTRDEACRFAEAEVGARYRIVEVPTPANTPRSWSFDDTKGLVVDGNGSAICAVIGGLNRNKDSAPYVNGRILAAALDLREALELAEGFISGFEDDESQEGMDFLLSTIRAAISKATGQPTERLFVVTEVVQYEVMAHSEAEAVNFIKEHDDRNDYVVSVSEREAVEKESSHPRNI